MVPQQITQDQQHKVILVAQPQVLQVVVVVAPAELAMLDRLHNRLARQPAQAAQDTHGLILVMFTQAAAQVAQVPEELLQLQLVVVAQVVVVMLPVVVPHPEQVEVEVAADTHLQVAKVVQADQAQ